MKGALIVLFFLTSQVGVAQTLKWNQWRYIKIFTKYSRYEMSRSDSALHTIMLFQDRLDSAVADDLLVCKDDIFQGHTDSLLVDCLLSSTVHYKNGATALLSIGHWDYDTTSNKQRDNFTAAFIELSVFVIERSEIPYDLIEKVTYRCIVKPQAAMPQPEVLLQYIMEADPERIRIVERKVITEF